MQGVELFVRLSAQRMGLSLLLPWREKAGMRGKTLQIGNISRTIVLCSVILLLISTLTGCSRRTAPPAGQGARTRNIARTSAPITSLRNMNGLVCSECHNALTVDTGGRRNAVSFSHENHLNRGYHCSNCHPTLVHDESITPGHPQCFPCHDGKKASRDCEYCHIRRSDINPHPPKYLPMHDEDALRGKLNCVQCHDKSFCQNCHTLQMPHPRGWELTHGIQVGTGDCARCHTRSYCMQCHQSTEPPSHGRRDWMKIHGASSQSWGNNCALCHSPNYCFDCHKIRMPHPSNWTHCHVDPGRKQTGVCVQCHDVQECRTCHGRRKILGHPAQFITGHAQAARQPNPDCRVCHDPGFCKRCHPTGINGKIFPGGK